MNVGVDFVANTASRTRRLIWLYTQANLCHYIHKYLHGNIICHISTMDVEHWKRVAAYFKAGGRRSKQARSHSDAMQEYMTDIPYKNNVRGGDANYERAPNAPNRRTTWGKPLVAAFNKLISAVRFRQGGKSPTSSMLFFMDERIMEYTSEWCNACNLQATNAIKIKNRLFGATATSEDQGCFRPLLNVPLSSDLPMGMRLMHDTYLFIYITCTCISVMVENLTLSVEKQAKVRDAIQFGSCEHVCKHFRAQSCTF